MEIKKWTYEDMPDFDESVDGASVIETTGEEVSVCYFDDVEYAKVGDTSLILQILIPVSRNDQFNPESDKFDKKMKCFVFIQGSGWMEQHVCFNLPQVAKLAARGYVAAIVQYRHSGIAPFPAQAEDTLNAIRYLRKNAQKYGIDPDNIVVAGDSSGGHTAMWAGLLHNDDTDANLYPGVSSKVKGIVNYYGSVSVMLEDGNPSTVNHHMPDSPEGLEMGGVNLKEHPELCRKLSVECNIDENTDIAPVLIFHGTKDRIVNTRQSVILYQTLKKYGKEASLYLVKGADHGGAEFWTDEVLDIVCSFIEKVCC